MIPLREQEYIRERFEQELEGRVKLDYFTQQALKLFVPGREECATCEATGVLLDELSSLSDKVSLKVHQFADAPDEAKKLGVDKVPGIVLRGPANRALRFFGIPGGNEFPNFVEAMIEVSKQKASLAAESAKQLKKLKDDVSITVYVTPTCPHCPGVVRTAYRFALASPKVDAAAVEVSEFPRLAQQIGVRAVPLTTINDHAVAGALDEAQLLAHVLKAVDRNATAGTTTAGGATSEAGAPAGSQPDSGLIIPR